MKVDADPTFRTVQWNWAKEPRKRLWRSSNKARSLRLPNDAKHKRAIWLFRRARAALDTMKLRSRARQRPESGIRMMKQHSIVARMTVLASIAIVIVAAVYAAIWLGLNIPWAGFNG